MRSILTLLMLLVYSTALAAPMPAVNSEPVGCAENKVMKIVSGTWQCADAAASSIPTGLITFVVTGACPSGWTEVAALAGMTLFGTVAANADVGTKGGNDNITPAGTINTQTFTGTPFSTVINHTHAVNVTDTGHAHNQQRHGTSTGGLTGITTAPDTTSSNPTALGPNTASATTGITATTSNPAGGVASITPAGSVSQATFTGTQTDNRSAFTKVIFCSKD